MSTDRISAFVHDLCCMDRYGGRCIRLDNDAWQVLDVSRWTEEQAQALRAKYPSLSARVMVNRASLSGFSIMLQLNRASVTWTSVTVTAILIATVAAVARHVQI